MTMQSSNLLPALRELPGGGGSGQQRSFRDNITEIVNMDRAMYAGEFAAGVSFGLWYVFEDRTLLGMNVPGTGINVDDEVRERLTQAHESVFGDYEGSLTDHWKEMMNLDPVIGGSFIEELRGEAALREAASLLGYDETIGNVDDQIFDAFVDRYPRVSESQSLYEHYHNKLELGEQSAGEVVNKLKGQIGEYIANDHLIENGYPDLQPAPTPDNPYWDSFSEQSNTYFQTKVGYEDNLHNLAQKMDEAIVGIGDSTATVLFPATSETIEAMSIYRPDLAELMLDIVGKNAEIEGHVSASLNTLIQNQGVDIPDVLIEDIVSNFDFLPVESISDGLETLVGNFGFDVPDDLVGMLPYIGEIAIGVRLVWGAVITENQFKAADRTTKNKMHVIQALSAMSRIGITAVTSAAGGAVGTAIGSILPVGGNIIGGGIGLASGVGGGMVLNHKLRPHMLNLALNITGLTSDEPVLLQEQAPHRQCGSQLPGKGCSVGSASLNPTTIQG